MKQLLILFFAFNYAILYSQAPQAVTYQAVATDAAGLEILSSPIGVRASVIQGQPNNPAVYIETHAVVTDTFGLFTMNVGQGVYVGGTLTAFNQIDWGTGPYYLKIEMDANGGTNYSFIGTNQILSVPYALYSNKADTANYAFYSDTSNFAQYSDTSLYSVNSLNDNDTDSTNELQTLSLNGDTLSISNGNSVLLNGLGGGGSGNNPTPGSTISFNAINNNFLAAKDIALNLGTEVRHPINGDGNGFIYVTGQNSNARVYLSKMDSIGNIIWDKTATNGTSVGIAIDLDNNGNIYITGTFRQTLTLDGQTITSNSNSNNMFVAKFNNSGNIQWIRFSVAGTGLISLGNDLASDNNGNVYVTGIVDGGNGPYSTANFSGTSILPYWKQIFVAKYDQNGSLLFVKTYISQLNQNNNSSSYAIEVDNNGIPYITGVFPCNNCQFGTQTYIGSGNIFLSQLDFQGNVQWIKKVGNYSQFDLFIDLATDVNNNIYITGGNDADTTAGFYTQGGELFIAKYNSSGVPIFGKTVYGLAPNITTETGVNISVGLNNKIYVSGSYNSHFVGSNFIHFSNNQIVGQTPFIIEFDVTTGSFLDFNEVASLNISPGVGNYSTVSRGDNVYMLLTLLLNSGIPFVNNNIQYQQSGVYLLRWK